MRKYQMLSKVIEQLQKARDEYIAKHGIEPTIWDWDEYEGLRLCAGVKKSGDGLTTSLRPYKNIKSIKPVVP